MLGSTDLKLTVIGTASQTVERRQVPIKKLRLLFLRHFKTIIEEGDYSSETVFNVEETTLFWKKMSKRTCIAREGKKNFRKLDLKVNEDDGDGINSNSQ
ncbi:hypothetical protein CEXT_338811 [Caerostris extrusa]|uniref:Uncharacterized protein n=1 Tax=Caerostris extrusa TaxID=172846 RepID=A0AAV4UWR4_CAEEX|nr:hypothetical protein CEXT_338811 [Caerostris extrusa]